MAERVLLARLARRLDTVEHAELIAGLGACEWTSAKGQLLAEPRVAPQANADRILVDGCTGRDDALVLVAKDL